MLIWIGIALEKIFNFIVWTVNTFFFNILPYTLNYIGAPLFIIGLLFAIGFIGGNILFFIIFMILGYYFIKGTLFSSPYSKVVKTQMGNVSNNNYASV
jgi:hypothetical protein